MKERCKKIVGVIKALPTGWTIPQLLAKLESYPDTQGLVTNSQLRNIIWHWRADNPKAGKDQIIIGAGERGKLLFIEEAYNDIITNESVAELFEDVESGKEPAAKRRAEIKVAMEVEAAEEETETYPEPTKEEVSLHETGPLKGMRDFTSMNRGQLRDCLKSVGISPQTVITETRNRKAWDKTNVLRLYCENLF